MPRVTFRNKNDPDNIAGGGGGGSLFAATFSSGSHVLHGFTATTDSGFHSKTHRSGQGPGGGEACEISLTGTGDTEGYAGWRWNPSSTLFVQGDAMFVRYKFRFAFDVTGNTNHWSSKMIDAGDGGGAEDGRILQNTFVGSNGTWGMDCDHNINGAPAVFTLVNGRTDQNWHAVQWKFKSSTTLSSGDGHLYGWFDDSSNGEGSPTAGSSGDFQLNVIPHGANGWNGQIGFGSYMDNRTGIIFQFAAMEVGLTFDSTWSV